MKAAGDMLKMKFKIEIDLVIAHLIPANDVFVYPWAERERVGFSFGEGVELPHEYTLKLNDL